MSTATLVFSLMLFQEAAATPVPTATPVDIDPPYVILIILIVIIAMCFWLFLFAKPKLTGKSKTEIVPTIFNSSLKIESQPIPLPTKQSQEVPHNEPAQPPPAENLLTPAIFITYRREDSIDVTGRIYDRLSQHFGKEAVFKDVDSIPLGVDFRKHLGDSVGQCDVLLTVIGRQWLAGERGQRRIDDMRDFVRIEMEAALKRDIPVVPVLVQGSSMPSLEDLPETLQPLVYRNGITVRPDPDFHQDMDRLIRGIEGYLKKKIKS